MFSGVNISHTGQLAHGYVNRTGSALTFVLLAVLLSPGTSLAQCSWSDEPVGPGPEITLLRSVDDGMQAPTRLAVDMDGNVYSADPLGRKLYKHSAMSRIEQIIDVAGRPTALAIDDTGSFYVADGDSGSVNVFDPDWNFLYPLGIGPNEFLNPNDIAIDPDPAVNRVYVSDGGSNRVRVYDLQGNFKFDIGEFGGGFGQFNFPSALHVSAGGELMVGDQNNDRVQIFDRQGVFKRCFGAKYSIGSFSTRFGRILGITSDSLDRIYVADGFQGEIKVFTPDGLTLSTLGGFGEAPGQLRTPMGLIIDPFNRLWVASVNNSRTEVFGLDEFTDPLYLETVVLIKPVSYKLPKPGKTLLVYLRVKDTVVTDIDPSTVTVNGYQPRRKNSKKWKIKDFDGDGLPELRLQYDARKVLAGAGPGEATTMLSTPATRAVTAVISTDEGNG